MNEGGERGGGPRERGGGLTVRTLRLAVGALVAEAAGLGALVVYLLVGGDAATARGAIVVTLFCALAAVGFGWLARALWRRQAWARSPAIVMQLLLVPVGYSTAAGGLPWLGVPVIVLGLGGAAALIAPSTREALVSR